MGGPILPELNPMNEMRNCLGEGTVFDVLIGQWHQFIIFLFMK